MQSLRFGILICALVSGCSLVNPLPPCTDDVDCQVNYICQNGTCTESIDTGSQIPCTLSADSSSCPEGLICSEDNVCIVNQCATTPDCPAGYLCADGGTCGLDESDPPTACSADADCADDQVFCNGSESCDLTASVCVSSGSPCGTDRPVCDEALSLCVECENDSTCQDGQICNGDEWCAMGFCKNGPPPCDANDYCDPENGNCLECSTDDNCDDGLFCNGLEACSADGFCASGSDPCLGDFAYCNEAFDLCQECKVSSDCEVTDYCASGVPYCSDGKCLGGPPCQGNTPFCSAAMQRCNACEDDSHCIDAAFCNGEEKCIDGECMSPGNPCDVANCLEDNDICGECATNEQCDDGIYCNGQETCVDSNCVNGSAPCVEDSPEPKCSEALQGCVQCLDNTDCPNDDGCKLVECNNGTCGSPQDRCIGTTPYCLSTSATQWTCFECSQNQECVNNRFCDGIETCNLNGNLYGNCEAGDYPCQGSCDESANRCYCYWDGNCTDSIYCNGEEQCVWDTFFYSHCYDAPPPCSAELCEEENEQCIQCLQDADCDDGVCEDEECVDCRSNTDCTVPTAFCNTENHDCVECLADDDCPGEQECNDNVCAPGQND
jgi:hypothetical protein